MIGELIEKLCILNIKLYEVCDKKADAAAHPENYTKADLVAICAKDIELCRQRARMKKAIDEEIKRSITSGEVDVADEVKAYGNKS